VNELIYPIVPMGKPRMTRADKWKKRPEVMRYRAFCDEVRLRGVALPESGAHVTFVLPMPASWSKKKRQQHNGQPHQAKPDCDNMLKALMDALYEDDAHIWDCRITKVWGEIGQIIIREAACAPC
jgi:Holliday junction resolvase RusA-like endonuclease